MTAKSVALAIRLSIVLASISFSVQAEDEATDRKKDLALSIAPSVGESKLLSVAASIKRTDQAARVDEPTKDGVDPIAKEIANSLEEHPTLVVWLIDESFSVASRKKQLLERTDRIYADLDGLRKTTKVQLTASVVSFGSRVTLQMTKPTKGVESVKKAITGIRLDPSGEERVFQAVQFAAENFGELVAAEAKAAGLRQNVMVVAFTDEAGDDQEKVEQTIVLCRRRGIPVFVVGPIAPFGQKTALVKWVDPDPDYDQTPQWARLTLGPESVFPERLKSPFSVDSETEALDSGFGPYALTRLCYQTGGVYFMSHPLRAAGREITRKEVPAFAPYFARFFDTDVMQAYRPAYSSPAEQRVQFAKSKVRSALALAAKTSQLSPSEELPLRFEKQTGAAFANALTNGQKSAAKLEPRLMQIDEILKLGEADRSSEMSPRWQAGFDLAKGQALAARVRAESYNMMLALAKRGLRFKDAKNDTWVLEPDDKFSAGSAMARRAAMAKKQLEEVVKNHPNTPWAHVAKKELENSMGWKWMETRTGK